MARCILRISSYLRSMVSAGRNEGGQMLMLGALVLTILLGMTAMAVDLGGFASQRRDLQNAADAIGLAAAQELPDEDEATAVAQEWADANGIDWSDVTLTITQAGGGNPNPKVRVVIDETHDFVFIGVLGIEEAPVSAAAAAIKTSPGGSGDLVPWAILEATRESAGTGEIVTLKYDANNVTNGNFGGIRIDGNGGNVYGNTIVTGSDSRVCAKSVSGCTDTSPVCSTYVCQSQTGNLVGQTRTGTDWRMTNTDSHCDSFGEVFEDAGDDQYTVVRECNPWLDGGYENNRLVLVPVVESLCNGSCNMDVVEFALFWLEGYDGGKCSGNSCEVKGRFINAELTTGALVGVYDPNSSLHFARLSE